MSLLGVRPEMGHLFENGMGHIHENKVGTFLENLGLRMGRFPENSHTRTYCFNKGLRLLRVSYDPAMTVQYKRFK